MNDTKKLLDQLRIDSPALTDERKGSRSYVLVAGALSLLLAGVAFMLRLSPDSAAVADTEQVEVASSMPTPVPVSTATNDAAVLNASGYVVARRQATVSAKITARVTAVFIDEGQRVEDGQVIATLDDSNLQAARQQSLAQLEHAKATLRAARLAFSNEEPLFARVQQQVARGAGSNQDFDLARARKDAAEAALDIACKAVAVAEAALAVAERNLDDAVVRAPFSGIVTVKAAQPGEMVSPVSAGGGFTRTGIGTIVDMESLEVDVDVSESFINRVTAGQAVMVSLNAYPELALAGRVITVVPTADRNKATVKVRIAFEERDARILPDMAARVAFLRTDQ